MKKKIVTLGLILILIVMMFVLTGCGNKSITQNYRVGELMESQLNDAKWSEETVNYQSCVAVEGTNIGDIITCGGEEFYVISNDGTNIKMLAKYNLYVGNYRNADDTGYTMHSYSESEATGIQHSSMKAGGNSNGKADGITYYSSSETKGANNSDYEGSIVEKYVNEYLKYLVEKANLDSSKVSATLITVEELESLGCSIETKTCEGAPEWVYSTNYWTKSKAIYGSKESENALMVVSSDGKLKDAPYGAIYLGVRPVITIPATAIENQ